jgi:ketosteroid isomerase-like protein
MNRRTLLLGALAAESALGAPGALGALGAPGGRSAQGAASVRDAVRDVEQQFAATMARRDFGAFPNYISEEAIFLGSECNRQVLRGRMAIVAAWRGFFDGPTAPFAWAPDFTEVLDSGGLALSSGPVRNPAGALTGRFNSIWRLESDGRWRVVFDQGSPLCSR